MGSHLSSSPESAPAALAGLRAAGFTEPEAGAIGELVKSTTGQAVDTLRNEFVRWHAYLALYLLAQIGIVLLIASLLSFADRRSYEAFASGDQPTRPILSWEWFSVGNCVDTLERPTASIRMNSQK
jgi:hypothetical protein